MNLDCVASIPMGLFGAFAAFWSSESWDKFCALTNRNKFLTHGKIPMEALAT